MLLSHYSLCCCLVTLALPRASELHSQVSVSSTHYSASQWQCFVTHRVLYPQVAIMATTRPVLVDEPKPARRQFEFTQFLSQLINTDGATEEEISQQEEREQAGAQSGEQPKLLL